MRMRLMCWFGFATAMIAMLTACGGGSTPTAGATTIGQGATAVSGSPETTTTVHVVAKDFAVSLDTSSVPSGRVAFVLRNAGSSPHNFAIKGNDIEQATPNIGAGEETTLSIALPQGKYSYSCTVAGHEQLGMKGVFTST